MADKILQKWEGDIANMNSLVGSESEDPDFVLSVCLFYAMRLVERAKRQCPEAVKAAEASILLESMRHRTENE